MVAGRIVARCAVAAMAVAFPPGAGADQHEGKPPAAVEGAASQAVATAATSTDPASPRTSAAKRRPAARAWPRVQVPDPVAGHAAREALDRAWTLLANPRCSGLLTQFTDREGQPLDHRLEAVGVDVQTYLGLILFIDDTRHPVCVTGVLGFTVPGTRVVRLCSGELKRTWRQDSTHVVAAFIHEMLHTLGLGENPPSSRDITRRVLDRCREE